jgi:hypothetical protein
MNWEDLLFLRLFAVGFERYEFFFEDAGSDTSSP